MYRHLAIISLVSFLSTTTTAVSLADFKPKIPSLPARCETVYRYPIEECVPEDFQGDNACSDQCQSALEDLVPFVNRECAGVRVGADTIIGIFLAGNGVTRLCPSSLAPVPAPLPSPPSENNSGGPSRGQNPSEDSLVDDDIPSVIFAPTEGLTDNTSLAFDRAGPAATPTDDDTRGSQSTDSASSDSTNTEDEGDSEDGSDDGEDGGGGGGSPFDDEGGNSAISSSNPNVLCLMVFLAAFGIIHIT